MRGRAWGLWLLALLVLAALSGTARASPQGTDCGPNGYLIGFNSRTGVWVDRLQAVCGVWDPAAGRIVSTFNGKLIATSTGGAAKPPAICPAGGAITDLRGSIPKINGNFVAENITISCSSLTAPHPEFAERRHIPTSGSGRSDDDGNLLTSLVSDYVKVASLGLLSYNAATGGTDFSSTCAPNTVAVGYQADAAQSVGLISLKCGPWPVAAVATNQPPPIAPPGSAVNFDLPGNDMKIYPAADPANCQAACQANGQCQGWTWAKAGTHGLGLATCFLKNPAPQMKADNCCISQVKPGNGPLPVGPIGALMSRDLPGNNYRPFPTDDPKACQTACYGDAQCKAWTWAKAGTGGVPVATCYMKNPAPALVVSNCCMSQLKPGVTAGGASGATAGGASSGGSAGGGTALPPTPPGASAKMNLPGGDLANFSAGDPNACAGSCAANGACKAWTWAVAGTAGLPTSVCFLKKTVPKAQGNPCCISGIKPVATGGAGSGSGGAGSGSGGGGSSSGGAVGYDRPGYDFAAAPSSDPMACAQTCAGNPMCKAWTWTKPGTNGISVPMCFLKNPAPSKIKNDCCVSGKL